MIRPIARSKYRKEMKASQPTRDLPSVLLTSYRLLYASLNFYRFEIRDVERNQLEAQVSKGIFLRSRSDERQAVNASPAVFERVP